MEVTFGGTAFGRGHVVLAPRGHGAIDVTVELQDGSQEKRTLLRVEGQGTCDRGTVRALLGAADSPESDTKILGGRLEGLVRPQLVDSTFFGMWLVDAVRKDLGEHRRLRGFVEERSLDDPLPALTAKPVMEESTPE